MTGFCPYKKGSLKESECHHDGYCSECPHNTKDDTISRQAAMDAICDYTDDLFNQITALEDLPSAQPEPQWIPVTKKAHPDLPIRVQVQIDNGWIITAYYQECEWLSVPDCGEPLQVEAWRELPEPYTERREE